MKKLISLILLIVLCLVSFFTVSAKSERSVKNLKSAAKGIVEWKINDIGDKSSKFLINNTFLQAAGTTPGDWYPIGLSRLEFTDDYDAYLSVIKNKIKERYKQPSKLSSVKSTEWHRISLSILACGGDPTDIGLDQNNNIINLIADGTYNRGKTVSLGRQGINGWIWGLITLDSMQYEIPKNAFYSRDDIITEILKQQHNDGGFSLSGNSADPDITAMAIQALSPYYNDNKKYSYTQKSINKNVSKSVREVIDSALNCLSKLQSNEGDFFSWGTQNVESACQVTVALCSLGINPQTDSRFIKNGNSLIDGIFKYQMNDGGFIHSFKYDSNNPDSSPTASNTMASEQVLYTLAAVIRQENRTRNLYDFRSEQSKSLKKYINNLENEITNLNGRSNINSLLKKYFSIPKSERFYVRNFNKLYDKAILKNIDVKNIEKNTKELVFNNTKTSNKIIFNEEDKKAVDNLPKNLTTKEYVIVIKLLEKLNSSENFSENTIYLEKLNKANQEIQKIRKEINQINADIKEKLYPLSKMTLKNKRDIDDIVNRCNSLSDYDKAQINNFEDVIKTKTKIDNLLRALIISIVSAAVCLLLIIFTIKRIQNKRRKKLNEMKELESLFEDEE